MAERWEPVPVPQGDGRHDIGDNVRAAIALRLTDDWSRRGDLSESQVHELSMWAAASVRALLHELGTLNDAAGQETSLQATVRHLEEENARLKAALRKVPLFGMTEDALGWRCAGCGAVSGIHEDGSNREEACAPWCHVPIVEAAIDAAEGKR